jgi:hypothetical protein
MTLLVSLIGAPAFAVGHDRARRSAPSTPSQEPAPSRPPEPSQEPEPSGDPQ